MPWGDSFRKKRLSTSSPASKKKDQSRNQQQQQVDQNHRGTSIAAESTSSLSQPASSNAIVANHKDVKNRHPPTPPDPSSAAVISPRTSGLPQEIYQKIKEFDQAPSILAASNAEALLTKVQEKYEFTQPAPDGSLQTFICQTVEIIKRPGQSLGLYLREGNGINRLDGVFVSRLADGFDLQKSGVLNTGDEILSVNDVNVTKMGIDEVVVMISIPRRLVLRTRTAKGHYSANAITAIDSTEKTFDPNTPNKPIAVLKQLPREESRESGFTDDGTPLMSSHLIATAQTSLGVKARQQESAAAIGKLVPAMTSAGMPPLLSNHHPIQTVAPTMQTQRQDSHTQPQRSLSDRWSYNRQLAMYTPRLLDSEGRPLNDAPADGAKLQTECKNGAESWSSEFGASTNPNPGISLRSQRLQSHYQTLERATAAQCSTSFTAFSASTTPHWNAAVPEPAESVPQRSFSGYGVSTVTPRSVLRQPSSTVRTSSANSMDTGQAYSNVKSNSLPRRQPGRTIKWRTDLPASSGDATAMNSVPSTYYYPSDVSDSDGAVSAPEFPMSPPGRGVPQPVYPLPRPSAGGKTVDDIFSRAEYQAWARSTAQNGRFTRGTSRQQHRDSRYTGHYSQMANISNEHFGLQRQHIIAPLVEKGEHGTEPSVFGIVYDANGKEINDSSMRTLMQMHWNENRSLLDDDDSSSSSIACGPRPVPPPRTSRLVKTRSSSLPPKGVLNRVIQRPVNGINDHGNYNPAANDGGGSKQPRNDEGHHGYVDVSPLPHRRLPLALAAASPGFGYTADGPVDNLTTVSSERGNPAIAALTGVLVIRIIEGRGLRSRDPEELYCVLEVDGEHRARTEVSDWHAGFKWNETFEMDVWDCRQTDFYIYSWHPQYRHKLRHHTCLQLVDALLSMTKFDLNDDTSPTSQANQKLQSNHGLALSLDPRGQLFIQIAFRPMASAYRRKLAISRSSYWGMPLQTLIERETTNGAAMQIPVVVWRLIQEIERRGVDTCGLYVLCGSSEKKRILREALERDPHQADITADSVPDLNILTSVVKDFLRELPEPLVPHSTFQMLLDAWKVCVANEKEGNARLILGVVDCLSKANKCTLMVLMDHFKYVISQSPHNGLSATKCSTIFGPLIFCTSQAFPLSSAGGSNGSAFGPLKSYFSFLDHRLAARLLEVLLEFWPSRKGTSDSGVSMSSTITMTSNGSRSLAEAAGNPMQESNC